MPNLEEHCKSSLARYGVEGRDIHKWMDEPSSISPGNHRKWRHNPVQMIPKIFIDGYGLDLAKYIMMDHLILDKVKNPVDTILWLMEKTERASVKEVAVAIDRSRATAQRLLQKLYEEGILERDLILIGLGGYKYIYRRIT